MKKGLFQDLLDPFQFFPNGDKQLMILSIRSLLNQSQFHLFVFQPLQIPDFLLRSGDGKPFLVEKFFNLQDKIQVLPSVEPLERPPLMGFDAFEFRFPIAKDMRFKTRNPTYLSDPIIEPFVGDRNLIFPPFKQPGQSHFPPSRLMINIQ
jgi:hypothetical protein